MDIPYSFTDYEKDNAELFSKNQEEPFLYKLTDVLYPNPEFLSVTIPEDVNSYKVHLCIFYIEHICVLPFVKYAVLTNETNKTVNFVEFEQTDDTSNLETRVLNQFDLLFDREGMEKRTFEYKGTFEDQGTVGSKGTFDKAYKGFIIKNDNIYMFFDITSLLTANHKLNKRFIYAVAHEFCDLKQVFDYNLGKNIRDLFVGDADNTFPKCAIMQPWFYNLDEMLELIEIPRIAYICMTSESGDFKTMTSDELSDIFVPTDCLMDYDDIGFLYYFSEDIVEPVKDASYVRFIVFGMKSKFANKNAKNIYKSTSEEYNSVTFTHLRKTKIWGIKSIDQFIPI